MFPTIQWTKMGPPFRPHSKNLPNHPIQFAILEIEKQNSHTQDPKSHHNGGFFSSTNCMQPTRFLKCAGFLLL
jgi:hypothetical protein